MTKKKIAPFSYKSRVLLQQCDDLYCPFIAFSRAMKIVIDLRECHVSESVLRCSVGPRLFL
jgi:hypothetical protein